MNSNNYNNHTRIIQMQKLETIGSIMSGFSHEMKNNLAGILGGLELVELEIRENRINSNSIIEIISICKESTERSINLLNLVLSLSKDFEFKFDCVNINESIKKIVNFCKLVFPKNIHVEYNENDNPLLMEADKLLIKQVLLNFCINGLHAMTIMREENQNEEGLLSISSRVIEADHELWNLYPGAENINKWVEIQINDTGVGIDEETKINIFKPFYSTKSKDHGTGMGLTISLKIIEQHKGTVKVLSHVGFGTNFTIYFPALQ